MLTNSKFVDPVDEVRTMESLKRSFEELDKMDQKVFRLLERERQKNREKINRKITASNLQYQPGEYVLVSSKGTSRRRNKLKLYWTGPWIITGVPGHNIYEVRDPLGNAKTVHSSRVSFYDGKEFQVTEEIKMVYTYNRGIFEVADLIGLRANGQDFELTVHWKGFELSGSTWEKIDELYQDIPTRIVEYLSNEKEENPLAEHLYEA